MRKSPLKFCLLLFFGAFITAATTPVNEDVLVKYRTILLERQSGAHVSNALSPELKKEFLKHHLISSLAQEYRKSVKKSGHPAEGSSRLALNAFQRMYEKHLIEVAMRAERIELNGLMNELLPNYPKDIDESDSQALHILYLSHLYDRLSLEAFDAYSEKLYDRARDFSALSLYVLTETYVRLAIFDIAYRQNLEDLERNFWTVSLGAYVRGHNLQMAIQALQKFSGKELAELVTEYQSIFRENRCGELLTTHHVTGEE